MQKRIDAVQRITKDKGINIDFSKDTEALENIRKEFNKTKAEEHLKIVKECIEKIMSYIANKEGRLFSAFGIANTIKKEDLVKIKDLLKILKLTGRFGFLYSYY